MSSDGTKEFFTRRFFAHVHYGSNSRIIAVMATKTVENYLKHLYEAQQSAPGQLVAMGKLAEIMGVVAGTATTMVRALADSGLVVYEPREGVKLTSGGEQLALHVLRRHRLVESFLVEVLGMDWAEVHPEAEELEHAISDKVLEKIDAFLKHPSADPHGDPIPNAKGHIANDAMHKLSEAKIGVKSQIVRVTDQRPDFLKFANDKGLAPKVLVIVKERDLQADALTVEPENKPVFTLSTAAASKFLVKDA